MKKFITLLIFSSFIFTQSSLGNFGIQFYGNLNSLSEIENSDEQFGKIGFAAGLNYKFPIQISTALNTNIALSIDYTTRISSQTFYSSGQFIEQKYTFNYLTLRSALNTKLTEFTYLISGFNLGFELDNEVSATIANAKLSGEIKDTKSTRIGLDFGLGAKAGVLDLVISYDLALTKLAKSGDSKLNAFNLSLIAWLF